MAIAQLLAQILAAQYGRDVRQSIHDAIEECYDDVSTAKTLADEAALGADEAAENANEKATLANTKAGLADAAATNAETAAYRSMLWRKTASAKLVSVYPVPESPLHPKVSGTFTQSGTGDPSPSNIRPITPWLASESTAKVKRTGKNLFPLIAPEAKAGLTLTQNIDGSLTINGTASGNTIFRAGVMIPSGAALPLHLSVNNPVATGGVLVRWGSSTTFAECSTIGATRVYNVVPSTDSAEVQIRVAAGVVLSNFSLSPQLELGSVATPYEPYSGQEITLTAPQEIPAGWMDNEGKGQITHGYIASYVDETVPDGWVSSIGELSAGAQVVYPLATPIDITPAAAPLTAAPHLDRVTPRQNVLTASTGNVELTYAKSPIQESNDIATAIAAL